MKLINRSFLSVSSVLASALAAFILIPFTGEAQVRKPLQVLLTYLKSESKTDKTAVSIPDDRLPTPVELEALPAVVPEKAAELMKEIKAPEGFEASVFATAPAVNYPVFVAAAPDGTLFVSSDGNGSLDRKPNLGRVLRVRDLDGDGRADEVKAFVENVDSPRGLVWDHDRLYLLHPPDISVFIDKDGDGISDEKKTLVEGIAFTFEDRPADHGSNGLELGVDGWLYAAIGDFGFMEAVGTDGRKLQLRGGGVVRVRPDGTGLELYARGTRNILETAVSPLLDLFARDNTNDGGGWDVRLHHFTGMEDHGYPRAFKNFTDEIVEPLADYGGGSGCGAAWIDEPGIPREWNNAAFTADWGRGWIYRHELTPDGATYKAGQEEFLGFTRPTDLDVDGYSRVYAASWKGATFKWAGNDVGYIVQLKPKGHAPEPLPAYEELSDEDLVKQLESPSHRRRLEAQRTLLRRNASRSPLPGVRGKAALRDLAADLSKPLAARIAALYGIALASPSNDESANEFLMHLSEDPSIAAWAVRALGDQPDRLAHLQPDALIEALRANDSRTRKEAALALARWHGVTGAPADGGTPIPQTIRAARLDVHARAMIPLLTDRDSVVAHTAMQALRQLKPVGVLFAILDEEDSLPAERDAVLRVLRGVHAAESVSGLIERLNEETDLDRRKGLLTALARLHFKEGEWTGRSWGTRPDTRGPYYQPEEWKQTKRIAETLDRIMQQADASEAAFLAGELTRHRMDVGPALDKLLSLAHQDREVLPAAVGQLARAEEIPAKALPLLVEAASADGASDAVRADAVTALSRSELDEDGVRALLAAMPKLQRSKTENHLVSKAADAFYRSKSLEKHIPFLDTEAAKLQGEPSVWAEVALLRIHDRADGKQTLRAEISAALEHGWVDANRRAQMIEASVSSRSKALADLIIAATHDSNKEIADAARHAVERLRLDTGNEKTSAPLIGAMPVDEAVSAVLKTRGERSRGEELFARFGCVACHTTTADEPLKGPYLGNIADTYPRKDLAEAVLLPNKSLAQGFVSQRFTTKDDFEYEGFVTQEAAATVTIRNVAAQEFVLDVGDIVKREKLETSLMPEGLVAGLTVKDFASLLDYLEALAKEN